MNENSKPRPLFRFNHSLLQRGNNVNKTRRSVILHSQMWNSNCGLEAALQLLLSEILAVFPRLFMQLEQLLENFTEKIE